MPETPRRSMRRVIIGAAAAVVIIAVLIVVANRSDDSDSSSTDNSGLVIQSPATVTGITGIGGAVGASSTTAPGETVVRTLVAPGKFDCTNLGSWQPYPDIGITIPVGEPAANATCGDGALDLPSGFCSTAACSAIPDTWFVDVENGVAPEAVMLVVAPTSATTGQFICVKDSVLQPKQTLPLATRVEQACTTATSDSVEIPYVPPATSDIPYVPPPVSVDIPSTGG